MTKPLTEYNLNLTVEELQVMNDALMQAPYGKVAPLIKSINEQIVFQNQINQANSVETTSGATMTPGA